MMRNYFKKPTIAFAIITSVVFASQNASATEARTRGLGDNPMVEDEGDIVDYPGMLSAYGNTAFTNLYPPTSGLGEGVNGSNIGALFGKKTVFGVWVHRASQWDDLEMTSNLLGLETPLPPVYDLMDLFLGMSNGFGLRLSMSAGLNTSDQRDEENDMVSSGSSAAAFDLQLGYSFDTNKYHGDFGVGGTLSIFSLVSDGEMMFRGGMIPSFLIRHRSIIGPRNDVAVVVDALITRRAYSIKDEFEDEVYDDFGNRVDVKDDANIGNWQGKVVVGPRFKIPGLVSLNVGGKMGFTHYSGEVAEEKLTAISTVVFPGLVASAEVFIKDMLVLRGGIDYNIFWQMTRTPDTSEEGDLVKNDSATNSMIQSFSWSTGLGLTPGDFRIDATISQMLYFNGPAIIGGGDPGFLGMISVAYGW